MERMRVDANTTAAFLAGLCAGGIATGGVAYVVLRRSYQRRLDDEVAAVKVSYNDRLKQAISDATSLIPEAGAPFVGRRQPDRNLADSRDPWDDEDDGETSMGDSAEVAVERVEKAPIDPLEGFDELDGDGEPEEADGDGEGGSVQPDPPAPAALRRDIRHPYVISAEEIAESPPEFQQLTLTYYAGDKVLVDDKDEPIPMISKIVGPIRGPQDFGGISGDPHLRYVRNQVLKTDFEIILDSRSYAEVVLNYGQPNKER